MYSMGQSPGKANSNWTDLLQVTNIYYFVHNSSILLWIELTEAWELVAGMLRYSARFIVHCYKLDECSPHCHVLLL